VTLLLNSSHFRDVTQPTDAAFVQSRHRILGGLSPKALQRVREHLALHLEQRVTIQALARTAGLSTS